MPSPAQIKNRKPIILDLSRLPKIIPAPAQGEATKSERYRFKEANRRLSILQRFDSLLSQGKTKEAAAKQLRVGYATLWRWSIKASRNGYNGLLPQTDKCGRKPALKTRVLPAAPARRAGGKPAPVQIIAKRSGLEIVGLTLGAPSAAWRKLTIHFH